MLISRHLISPTDFTVEEIERIFTLADQIIQSPKQYSKICEGKILATMFFEPSTRTRLSFEAAMSRLGGSTLGFADPASSSITKGESLADTIRMISSYADIAVMRHPVEGAPKAASHYSAIPVINAGDGGHQHPTQTLTDLYTIRAQKGRLNNLTIGLCGDLKNGRTVHSLIEALSRYKQIQLYLISPTELRVPGYVWEKLRTEPNILFEEVTSLDECIQHLDILYMTRIQRERFSSEEEYYQLKDSYILDREKMQQAKKDMIVLHPLPRINEITCEVDSDPRACYFLQAQYGMYVRMALIVSFLGVLNGQSEPSAIKQMAMPKSDRKYEDVFCPNKHCITKREPNLPSRMFLTGNSQQFFKCEYCDIEIKKEKLLKLR